MNKKLLGTLLLSVMTLSIVTGASAETRNEDGSMEIPTSVNADGIASNQNEVKYQDIEDIKEFVKEKRSDQVWFNYDDEYSQFLNEDMLKLENSKGVVSNENGRIASVWSKSKVGDKKAPSNILISPDNPMVAAVYASEGDSVYVSTGDEFIVYEVTKTGTSRMVKANKLFKGVKNSDLTLMTISSDDDFDFAELKEVSRFDLSEDKSESKEATESTESSEKSEKVKKVEKTTSSDSKIKEKETKKGSRTVKTKKITPGKSK